MHAFNKVIGLIQTKFQDNPSKPTTPKPNNFLIFYFMLQRNNLGKII